LDAANFLPIPHERLINVHTYHVIIVSIDNVSQTKNIEYTFAMRLAGLDHSSG
jgi:hypothetical protein